jgi:AcrR family transcriptional regulator
MAPKVTHEYKKEVRERIMSAAEKLFSSKGYYDTSMDEIVAESRLSKGAIYGHFKSKEDLFVALQDKQLEESITVLASAFAPEDSARTKLEKVIGTAFGSIVNASKKSCRINLEFNVAAPRIKSIQRRRDERFMALHRFVVEIIKEGVEKREFRSDVDPNQMALILLAMADGLSLDWATTNLEFDWKALPEQVEKMVMRGLPVQKTKLV